MFTKMSKCITMNMNPFIIFLDIDRVLTTPLSNYQKCDYGCISCMNTIVHNYQQVKFVLISFRDYDEVQDLLSRAGFAGKIIDDVYRNNPGGSVFVGRTKEAAITEWLQFNPTYDYLIIDDSQFTFESSAHNEHIIQPVTAVGFSQKNFNQVVNYIVNSEAKRIHSGKTTKW